MTQTTHFKTLKYPRLGGTSVCLAVKCQRTREHLIQYFKTKPKTPRKPHYKKGVEAEKYFLPPNTEITLE
jgi:hypothetical protein